MIKDLILQHNQLIQNLAEDAQLLAQIEACIEMMTTSIRANHKILLCGNGGSAADAQHLSTELSGRFYKNRAPLDAEALHVNSSYLTAVANDLGYEHIFSRALEAKAKENDVLILLSTSGSSPNILKALEQAKKMGVKTIGLTGEKGASLAAQCDIGIVIPSTDTPRIQEAHLLIGHIICQQVESIIFPD